MDELLQLKVDARTKREAERVCQELGTTPDEAIRQFLNQLIEHKSLPAASQPDDAMLPPWETRAAMIESFYED